MCRLARTHAPTLASEFESDKEAISVQRAAYILLFMVVDSPSSESDTSGDLDSDKKGDGSESSEEESSEEDEDEVDLLQYHGGGKVFFANQSQGKVFVLKESSSDEDGDDEY